MPRDLLAFTLCCLFVCSASGCVRVDDSDVPSGLADAPVGATDAAEPAAAPQASIEPSPAPAAEASPEPIAPQPPWTRVVWTRDIGDGTDVISFGNRLVLMAHDSRDGRGERVVLGDPASYAKPLISPSGAEIVFSLREERGVYAVRWDGSGRRRIAEGFALAVWADPASGIEWVYVGQDERRTDPPSYGQVTRFRLDHPAEHGQRVWNAQPVSGDSFQLSADGRYAGALFPWPQAGVADLERGTWKALGEGCWTAYAGDGTSLFWYFDGSHRNLTIVDMDTEQRWQVAINTAPTMNGFEVYHPRWTNDSRHFVVTGPYTVGSRENKIRGGGRQVEIWLGRFEDDFSGVAEWTQITNNDTPDFYPDAWIAPAPDRVSRPAADARPANPANDVEADSDGRVVADARVLTRATVPTPESIAPYRNGLHAIEYEVVRIVEGRYAESRLVVAHWVIREGKVLPDAARPEGSTHRLTLERYDAHPELEGERLIMDSRAFALPLFYDIGSTP